MPETFEKYLTQAEERALFRTLACINDPLAKRDLAWMQLLRQTGIRVGALAGLTVADAQDAIRHKQLRVRGEINKGGHEHVMPITKATVGVLKTLLRLRREQGLAPLDDAPLIVSREHKDGSGMSVRSFQHRMRLWCLAAGIGVQATPHWFRHTFARRVLERSTAASPLRVAQRLLGHQNIGTTEVYTKPGREDLIETMEAVA